MRLSPVAVFALCCWGCASARADALDTLREFTREAKTGRAEFSQTVTSPDGAKRKTSSGSFEFARPNRFRFAYRKPFEQLIVGDGRKVWMYDADLNQVTVRAFDQALSATPAALLSGAGLERDFELSAAPAREGLEWVRALPRTCEGSIESLQIGFRDHVLAAIEIVDAFGQRSRIQFTQVATNLSLADATFQFTPPKGADLIEQK